MDNNKGQILSEEQVQRLNALDLKIREDVARRKVDMHLIRSAKKRLSVDDVIKVQKRLSDDEKLLSRFKNYNSLINRQCH